MRIAAAAVLLFAISTTIIVLLNNNRGNDVSSGTAGMKPKEQPGGNGTVNQPANAAASNELAVSPAEKNNEVPKETKQTHNAVAVKQDNIVEEKKEQNEIKDEKPLIAHNPIVENKPINDLPEPIHNPNVNGNKNDVVIGNAGTPGSELAENLGKPDVTTPPGNSSIIETGAVKQDNADVQFASDNSGNKGLRGFFRKVTRTIEKRTNIKATDDDDRLLIAGLAIKMN